MTGDCHVRFREGLGVKFPRATRSLKYQGIKKVLIYESFIESGYVIFSPRNVQPIKQPLAGV